MRYIHFLTIFFAVLMSTSAVFAAPLIAVDRGDGVLVEKESGKIIGKTHRNECLHNDGYGRRKNFTG